MDGGSTSLPQDRIQTPVWSHVGILGEAWFYYYALCLEMSGFACYCMQGGQGQRGQSDDLDSVNVAEF